MALDDGIRYVTHVKYVFPQICVLADNITMPGAFQSFYSGLMNLIPWQEGISSFIVTHALIYFRSVELAWIFSSCLKLILHCGILNYSYRLLTFSNPCHPRLSKCICNVKKEINLLLSCLIYLRISGLIEFLTVSLQYWNLSFLSCAIHSSWIFIPSTYKLLTPHYEIMTESIFACWHIRH